MRSALLLAAFLALSLALGVVCKESQEKVVPSKGRTEKMQSIDQLLKTLTSPNSASVVDELLKTLNEGSKDPKKQSKLQERDMHNFFAGLMGKRNTRPGTPADVTEESAPPFRSLQDPSYVE